MFKRKREQIRIDSLLAHLDFFSALQNRHQLGVADVTTPEIAELHQEIIVLAVMIRDKYNRLLELYSQHIE